MPHEIDELERRAHAARDRGRGAGARRPTRPPRSAATALASELEGVLRELARADRALAGREGTRIAAIQHAKAQIEEAREEAERAERDGDLQRAAELRYGRLPELARGARGRADRARGRTAASALLKEEVDAEDIAEVVRDWTGIPVSRCSRARCRSSSRMEERLHERVVGQDEAVEAVGERRPPLARRPGRPEPADRLVPVPRARPASARPSSRARSPSSCSTTSTRWCASTCPSTWRSTRSRA